MSFILVLKRSTPLTFSLFPLLLHSLVFSLINPDRKFSAAVIEIFCLSSFVGLFASSFHIIKLRANINREKHSRLLTQDHNVTAISFHLSLGTFFVSFFPRKIKRMLHDVTPILSFDSQYF